MDPSESVIKDTSNGYGVFEQNHNGSLQCVTVNNQAELVNSSSTDVLLSVSESSSSLFSVSSNKTSVQQELPVSDDPKDKKALIVAIGMVNLFAAMSFSLLGPFFPYKAIEKGTDVTTIGIIFGVFEFISFISCPILGNYLTVIGARFMFTTGIMVSGVCTVLFGVLGDSPSGYPFILLCFLSRSMDALGTSAMVTSSYAVLAFTFPRYLATVVGYLEMFTGVGMMLGPAIGGALYTIGGYGLPFYVIGGIQVISGIIGKFAIPSSTVMHQPSSWSILQLLQSPVVVLSGICVISATYSYTFLEATLAQHLQQFSLSPLYVSLVFLVAPTLYAIVTPLWGWMSDSKDQVFSLVIMGCVMSSIVFILIGPSPFVYLFISPSLYLVMVALVLMGIFYGPAIIPLFTAVFMGARSLGMVDDVNTYGIVSGYFNACFSLGAFLGPICGSAMMQVTDFSLSSTVCSGLFLLSACLVIMYAIMKKYGCIGEDDVPPEHELEAR